MTASYAVPLDTAVRRDSINDARPYIYGMLSVLHCIIHWLGILHVIVVQS